MSLSVSALAHRKPNGTDKSLLQPLRGNSLELADVMSRFGQSFLSKHNLPARHRKVMQQIVNCRTAVLGGHRHWCARCGFKRYLYHSCRNRHCPKCQTLAKERWREARQAELLPVPYFHNVFTLPHELNGLILFSEENQRLLIELLFKATSGTLLEFGNQTFGGKIGFTSVLHTWDQRLQPHFHLHCVIASGALRKTVDGYSWIAGGRKFLFPVRGLSTMFRAKFLTGLRQLFGEGRLKLPDWLVDQRCRNKLIRRLFRKPWVVYSKAPFSGARKLLGYLSRYTHRVALTNDRLLKLKGDQVVMTFRDRRDGDRRKTMTLSAHELIGRFLRHVLPPGLMRIRHHGFLANRYKRDRLATIRSLLGVEPAGSRGVDDLPCALAQWLEELKDVIGRACPCCGNRLFNTPVPSQLPSTPSALSRVPQKASTHLRGPPA